MFHGYLYTVDTVVHITVKRTHTCIINTCMYICIVYTRHQGDFIRVNRQHIHYASGPLLISVQRLT